MKRQSITLWAVITLLGLAGGFYLFYTLRKRSMHRLIVRQQKDFLMEQRAKETDNSERQGLSEDSDNSDTSSINTRPFEEKISVETVEKPEQQKGLSAERADAIWKLIEHEMNVNKIYTDTTVTRDIFSERVGCNHTWFSQVIKEHTGKSYLQFMNSRRIKEAVRILSDPASNITHKDLAVRLGFLSASTFYSTFKQQVGMSPAEYRKLALSESNDDQNNTEEC